jgi:hypothetical protein
MYYILFIKYLLKYLIALVRAVKLILKSSASEEER